MSEVTIKRTVRRDLPAIYWLYLQAFPARERKPFSRITGMVKQGRADLWTIRRDGRFAGFAATVNGKDLVLLDYFAVRRSLRGRGVGTEALKQFLEKYPGRGVFLEIESTFENADNRTERLKRRRFYENCGMEAMGTEADLFGVRMELLGRGCRLRFEEYRDFYVNHYSAWAAEHVKPIGEEV